MRAAFVALLLLGLGASQTRADDDLRIAITGTPKILFDSSINGCDPIDVPDVNARAYRDASGTIAMFALHYVNRALRGPDFDHLTLDCHVALASPLDPDPAHYADRNYVAATWTADGRTVAALVHHEYHADDFGRCRVGGDLGCWYNSVLAYQSGDGGRDFTRQRPALVAAAPFRQDVGQGRHRGFFNPSNIVADGKFFYAFISTTGWEGQPYGNCLFRTADPLRPGSWRAYDGRAYTIRYEDPYATTPHPRPCATIAPFTFPVGAVVRHRPSNTWIAVFQASSGGGFPLDGFYYATSRDLLHWGAPHILLAGKTLYDDLCKAGPSIINYPSLIDTHSPRRNFDDTGDHPDLVFATMDVAECGTRTRLLVREELTISRGGRS